jgi:uncharacterized protein YggE
MNPQDTHHFNYTPEQLNSFLKGVGIICAGVLTLFILVKTINEVKTYSTIGEDTSVAAQYGNISVSGKAEMFVKPDVTTFTVTINKEGATEKESVSKVAEVESAVLDALKKGGIKQDDIKTTYYYTGEKYGSKSEPCPMPKAVRGNGMMEAAIAPAPCQVNESVVVGFETTQTLEVKVRDIKDDSSKTGSLIATISGLGAKASNPVSAIDNIDELKKKVRDDAIIKARHEAEALAKRLGVRLVRVTGFSEGGMGYYPAYDMMSARVKAVESASPELPTGTNKVVSEVTLTYLIK